MSDLSRLLGDVYGDGPAPEDHADPESLTEDLGESPDGDTTASVEVPPPAPPAERAADPGLDWADETVLDEAFASWVPGPSPDAPAAERRLMGEQPADEPDTGATEVAFDAPAPTALPPDGPAPNAEWLFDESQPGPVLVPPPTEEPERARPWSRSDDDILPVRGRGRRRR